MAVSRKGASTFVLLGVVVLLIAYYIFVWAAGLLSTSNTVEVEGAEAPADGNYISLQMRVQDVDLTSLTMQATLLPVPHGDYAGPAPGEMSQGLRVVVTSGGVSTQVVAYPGDSIVDATTLLIPLDRGDASYPFDVPTASLQIDVQTESGDTSIPFDIQTTSSARPWILTGELVDAGGNADTEVLIIEGKRDLLSIALVMFYVLAILLTTLIAAATIGAALLHQTLDFSNVIWLSATMISFPTLRAAMPAAPPIGTTFDFLVFFPCMALVAILLVWTGAYMLWKEARSLHNFKEPAAQPAKTGELPVHE